MKDLSKLDPDLVFNISQICRNEDTGQLKLKSKTVSGYIIFYEGKIVWAASDSQEATLGELMIKTGKISREHFKLAKKMHAKAGGGRKITEILANISSLDEQDFREAMRSHIRNALTSLLSNKDIIATFEYTDIIDEADISFSFEEIF